MKEQKNISEKKRFWKLGQRNHLESPFSAAIAKFWLQNFQTSSRYSVSSASSVFKFFAQNLTISRRKRLSKLFLVFLAVFFVFFDGHTASAATSTANSSTKFKCELIGLSGGFTAYVSKTAYAESEADCQTWCNTEKVDTDERCNYTEYNSTTGKTTGKTTSKAVKNSDSILLYPFKMLLWGVFKILTWFLAAAAVLFGWVVNPDNVKFIMNNAGLYASWAMVRDFLNLGFILVLLYIAFCVIFQIGSYSDGWKKMLLTMVIMALLVNFSFPICRFIIDVSNIVFYYILNNGFSNPNGNGIMTYITKQAGLQTFLDAPGVTVAYLLAMIIFTFILAITFMVIAVLFIVRMVAIGMLIIFSPIGIAGAAFPFSKKYAADWWDSLFKYAFFAPIMMFMILIAYKILALTSRDSFNTMAQNNLGTDTGVSADFLGTMAFFSIPIVILWFGMGMAQKMSIAGASAVTGGAQKFAKWAGKQPWRGVKAGFKATGIPGGVEQSWKKNITQRFDRNRQNREAKVAGILGDKTAAERNMRNRAAEYEKNNESEEDLKKWATSGDAGAALALANKGKMDRETFAAAMSHIKDDRAKKAVLNKTSETRMDATIGDYKLKLRQDEENTKAAKAGRAPVIITIDKLIEDEYGSLTAEEWAKQKKLDEQFTHDATTNPHGNKIKTGARNAFNTKLNSHAKVEALKRMNGTNSAAVLGVTPPSGPTPPPGPAPAPGPTPPPPGPGPAPHP